MARKQSKGPTGSAATRQGEPRRHAGEGTPPGTAGEVPRVPGWLPPVLFVLLTGWLFREFIFSDRMLFGGDTLSLGYVARHFYAEMLKSGTFPFWNPELLGGTPFLEALSGGDSLYPPSALLLLVLEPYRALGWKLVLHIGAAGFFMFAWVRALGASRPAALVAAVGYMFSPYLVTLVHPGHDGKLFVTALAPLLFWGVERHFARPGMGSFAGIGLVVGLVLLTTHFQMAYFLFGAVGLYAAFRAVQVVRAAHGEPLPEEGGGGPPGSGARGGRGLAPAALRFGLFLAASVTGAAAAGVQFLPAVSYVTEYSRRVQTTRAVAGETGRAWSSSWSLHPEEAMSILIPEFAGNDAGGARWTEGTYWGRNATRDNLPTAGVVLLVLAAVSFAGASRRGTRWFFAGLAALALLFALGEHTPVWGLFYALVPGIRLFRAPDMVMFLFVFSAATLAALGTDRILRAAREGNSASWRPPLRVLGGVVGVMALLAALAASGILTSLWSRVVHRGMDEASRAALQAHQPFIVQGAFIAALLAGLVGALAWGGRRGKVKPALLLAGLVALVSVDQLRLTAPFVQTLDFHEWSRPDPNVQALLDRERGSGEPYRLLSFVRAGQDVSPAMHGIELAGGHHPNDLARYRELIGMVGSGFPENLVNPNIRRLLNVRYILWPEWQLGPVGDQGVVSRTMAQGGEPYETLLAEAGLPRARLVGGATVKSDAEAVAYMLSPDFDPEREVVLPEPPPARLEGGPVEGGVTWLERTPNRLRLAVTADRPSLLVVSDNWFPAWRASVNGADASVLRAYHTLRAVPVPAGSSTVEMWYRSDELARAAWISGLASLLLAGLGVAGWWRRRRRES